MMETRIEAYLAGRLEGEERARFERMLLADPRLRAEVEMQGRMEGSLRRVFQPDVGCGMSDVGCGKGVSPSHVRRVGGAGWRRILLAAAVVMLAAVGVWFAVWGGGAKPSAIGADVLYARLVSTGFEPAWVCEDDAKFLEYTREKLGASFLVKAEEGTRLVGWTYAGGVLGDDAAVLLVEVKAAAGAAGEKIVVVMDRAAEDRKVRVKEGSGLHVFRRKMGEVVMYEVTPLAGPRVVDRAYVPEKGECGETVGGGL